MNSPLSREIPSVMICLPNKESRGGHDFVAQVEDHLRDLGAEARKTHSGVKEASERAILHLRSLQTQYVAAVRRANAASHSSHPTTALFQSQDVLRPFLLAANHADASCALLTVSLDAMQLLLRGDAVCWDDGVHIVRVLAIQARAVAQRLGPLLANKSALSDAGRIAAVSSNVTGASMLLLGGIAGMVLGSSSPAIGTTSISSSAVPTSRKISQGMSSGSSSHSHTTKEDQAIALKILQTVTILVDSRSVMLSMDVWKACLLVCLLMGAGQQQCAFIGSMMDVSDKATGGEKKSATIQESAVKAGGNTDLLGRTCTNVQRAAWATMNQIVSILFDRAREKIVMLQRKDGDVGSEKDHDNNKKDSSILQVALQTLMDLCAIVHNFQDMQQPQRRQLVGPFVTAEKEELMPSPTICLSLIDMIFKQRCFDFFQVCRDTISPGEDSFNLVVRNKRDLKQDNIPPFDTSGLEFASQSIHHVAWLVRLILQTQFNNCCSERFHESSFITSSDTLAFSFYYYATSLSSTILTSYLLPLSENVYEQLDSIECPSIGDSKKGECFSNSMQSILKILVMLVSGTTDSYHSSEFEDGYIFNQTERESLNIGKSTSANSHGDSAAHHGLPSWSNVHTTIPHPSSDHINFSKQTWRAFLALEVLYSVIESHLLQILLLDKIIAHQNASDDGGIINADTKKQTSTISIISKAISDLATISCSNRERILHVVLIAQDDNSIDAEDSLLTITKEMSKLLSDTLTVESEKKILINKGENVSTATNLASKLSYSMAEDGPLVDTGLATWLAFKCLLVLVQSLTNSALECREDSIQKKATSEILGETFVSSLSTLQHYTKRMPGSRVIVSHALAAYEGLASSSIVLDSQTEGSRRQAVLTSLSKLCFPSWGKKRPYTQLKETNIDSISTMIWIVHSHYNKIFGEWPIILAFLDQLAISPMKSSKLPDSYYEKVTIISESLAQLPTFSTCFSDESLSHFIAAIIKLSETVSFFSFVEQSSMSHISNEKLSDSFNDGSSAGDSASVVKDYSFGGKLMSYAGRALGVGSNQTSNSSNQSFRRSVSDIGTSPSLNLYSEEFREAACSLFLTVKMSTPRSAIRKLPYPLLLLAVVAESNSHRFSIFEEAIALHLCDIVAKSPTAEFRSFSMDILIHFIPSSFPEARLTSSLLARPIAKPVERVANKPFHVVPIIYDDANPESHTEEKEHDTPISSRGELKLLKVLCQTLNTTSVPETAETGLDALHIILEGAGHNVSKDNFITVLRTLSILSCCKSSQTDHSENIDRSTKIWANVSSKSFQIFKLIFDVFLEPSSSIESPPSNFAREREAIINCCVAFGESRHDVNTALTATGMLWSLADQDPSTLDRVLSKLSLLALDNRPELRNCSVNTLFSCVVGLGDQFSDEQWENCLNKKIFGIMKDISYEIAESESLVGEVDDTVNSHRYKVAVHHSRDSVTKLWLSTQVLILRGLERVLRLFYSRLLASTSSKNNCDSEEPWILLTWKEILRLSLKSATSCGGRETLDIRLAGIELMTLCSQLSCKGGIVGAATSARVGTNMEVVGGALLSVRAATIAEDSIRKMDIDDALMHPDVEKWRQMLFDLAFHALTVDFREYLEQNNSREKTTGEEQYFLYDSVLSTILAKMANELAKLYECCKNEEMEPEYCTLQLEISIENSGNYESKFIYLLLVVINCAPSDKNSRYLNQVQRGVITLLQAMASNSSLRAFKALTKLSGDYMFVRSDIQSNLPVKDVYDSKTGANDSDWGEVLELEAAKTVVGAFESSAMSEKAKVVVMCSVLSQYLRLLENPGKVGEPGSNLLTSRFKVSQARYDLLTSVIDSGLEAMTNIIDTQTENEEAILVSVWERIMLILDSLLLPSPENKYDGYISHSKAFLNLVATIMQHIPSKKLPIAQTMLENEASKAVSVAFECSANDSTLHASKILDGAVDVFLACFMSLCQKVPSSLVLQTLSNKIVGEVEAEPTSIESGIEAKARQNLALALCESLRTTSNQELLIGLFPLLCRLTNVENDGLRRAAGKILGGINISEAILREHERADRAESKAREVEEENNALLEEIEYLQAENDELQRQLAIFSESSDYM